MNDSVGKGRMGQFGRKFQNIEGEVVRTPSGWQMITRVLLLFGLVLVVSGCNAKYAWHQKQTVTVDTPSGSISGSSTVEVAWNEVNSVGNYPASYNGEATVLDLGDGRYLFALIGEGTKHLAFRTIKTRADKMGKTLFAEMAASQGQQARVLPKHYPLLVTFGDVNDPASVKRVDPNNLDAAFGCPSVAGQAEQSDAPARERTVARTGERKTGRCYTLKSITLEITDEPVTTGKVEEVLGWLSEHPEPGLCPSTGRTTNIPFCRRVKHGDIIRR